MLILLAGIEFLPKLRKSLYQRLSASPSRRSNRIPRCCPAFRDVVQHSGISEKVDNFRMESVDNFDRNRWTTWNGMGGQLQMEWPVNIDRNTQLRASRPEYRSSETKELSMGRKLFVGNLSFSVGEAELKQLFEQKGGVESVTVMRDTETGRSRGFGFVEMSSEEAAQKAIKELNEFSVDGRNLAVNEARPKPERRGGFGGGGRGRGGFGGGGRGGQRREPRW
jgi:hypothetical protein